MIEVPDSPFATDGCSGNIYRTIMRRQPPWIGCCVTHDHTYWQGGSRRERLKADRALRFCVNHNGHPIIAVIMYIAVRIGGHPLLPFPWRWGYGWKWPRTYSKD